MREIHLNGYIDDEIWFGDEITPDQLHDELYPEDAEPAEDVRIILNSFGGSCNAATRMYDELAAYPGNVHVIISGTAASAATVLAAAANRLEMTPGSLYMIHDPSMGVYGNAADLRSAMDMLETCKDSILNIYCARGFHNREEVSAMMTATTWMDATTARDYGFVDGIVQAPVSGISNAAFEHVTDRAEAEKKVKVWLDRHRGGSRPSDTAKNEPKEALTRGEIETIPAEPQNRQETDEASPASFFMPAEQLHKRLDLLRPHDIY